MSKPAAAHRLAPLAFIPALLLWQAPAGAAAETAPVSIQAAEQTPENAQRYLSSSLPERYTVVFPGAPSFPMEYRRQTPARSEGTCLTIFEHSARGGAPFSGNPGDNVQRLGWADVEEIKQEGASVVQLNRDGVRLIWRPASEAAAARLAYAMEFLRQHCDPAADTGF